MDRLQQIRAEAGGSQDTSLDGSSTNDAFLTANDSSKFYSLSGDSSFDISIKEVDLTPSTSLAESSVDETDNIIPELSPIVKKSNVLDGYKIGKQIEAANILSGGVNIFDDNDNSYDENDLVIDDKVGIDSDDKSSNQKVVEAGGDLLSDGNLLDAVPDVESKDTEVVLQIDGKNVDAIDIGNGLYLYRKEGQEELAAVQIIDDDQQQPNFKFLKVRENAEGNLEVYEEIEIEVPKEMPQKVEKTQEKRPGHVPIKDISKVICESATNKVTEQTKPQGTKPEPTVPSNSKKLESESHKDPVVDVKHNLNMKMKMTESRKSPLSFTPISYHSTPNKDGVPLTKTMVDLHLQPSRHSDNVKKTIEVHTDVSKQKIIEPLIKLDEIKESDSIVTEKDQSGPQFDILVLPSDEKTNVTLEKSKLKENKKEAEPQVGQKPKEACFEKESPKQACLEKETPKPLDIIKKIVDTTCVEKSIVLSDELKKDYHKAVQKTTEEKEEFNMLLQKSNKEKKEINKSVPISISAATDTKLEGHTEIKKNEKLSDTQTSTTAPIVENKTKVENEVRNDSNNLKGSEMSLVTVSDVNVATEQHSKISPDPKQVIENAGIQPGNIENPKGLVKIPNLICLKSDLPTEKPLVPITKKPPKSLKTTLVNVHGEKKPISVKSQYVANELNESNKQEDDLGKKDIVIEKQEFDPKILNTVDISVKDDKVPIKNINHTKAIANVTSIMSKEPLEKCKSQEKDLLMKAEAKELPKTSNLPIPATPVSSSSVKKVPINITSSIASSKSEFTVFSNATYVQLPTVPVKTPALHKTETNLKPFMTQKPTDVAGSNAKPSLHKTSNIPTKNLKDVQTQDKTAINKFEVQKVDTSVSQVKSAPEQISKLSPDSRKLMENSGTQPGNIENLINKTLNKTEVAKVDTVEKKEVQKLETLTVAKKDVVQNKPVDSKPINNNSTPVPFGKWTEANRQEFLNKFKEVKVPSHSSTTQHLKQANDLNRRDILKKIDIQRQTSNAAAAKAQEIASKLPVKPENPAFTNAAKNMEMQEKISMKAEKSDNKNKLCVTKIYSKNDVSKDPTGNNVVPGTKEQRKDINNQDLIDKTIEDMLNKPLLLPAKGNAEEPKTVKIDEPVPEEKPSSKLENSLDAIEMKMNELHGIPFVERPIHELPKVIHNDKNSITKTESSSSQKTRPSPKLNTVSELLPFAKQSPRDIEIDEDELIEHEPVTGDLKLTNMQKPKPKVYENKNNKEKVHPTQISTKNEVIITENDFDKFARRNSITYEDKMTVNFSNKAQCNVVQTVVEKKADKSEHKHERLPLFGSKPPQSQPLKSNVNKNRISTNYKSDSSNVTNYPMSTKVQQAYNMTMNAKMQKKSPVTIIEDKPVKVVFMESTPESPVKLLNAQGAKLSPIQAPQQIETDANLSSCDSLDSDVLDAIDGMRSLDEIKFKTKHQRKQVLTPVEAPDLELIEPKDLNIECSPKKRRKIEHKTDKDSKLVVPKKSYLLGRTETESTTGNSHNSGKDTSVNHKSAASAIDNLVKAAELIETQSASATSNEISPSGASNIPVKRGRGRPRKYPVSDGSPEKSTPQNIPSPQKKARLTESKRKSVTTDDDDDSSEEGMILENWTMGKINENIVCPICNKLFRSENVVFKHVKHCTGPSPSRSDSDKRSPSRHSSEFESKVTEIIEKASEKIETKQTPKKRKSRDMAPKHLTDEIIVIEDTPIKEKQKVARHADKKSNPLKPTLKSKVPQITNNLVCEFCGKTFRQLSYLVSHKSQHKKEVTKDTASDNKKTVFSCEVCKKEFRMLHHLVQHRIIHNPTSAMPLRQSRKSSSEQNEGKNVKNQNLNQNLDQSAGFRCEPCDKSFRKLHHLVEHRETHDCINRQSNAPEKPATIEKIESSHVCNVCKKTFKSIELMLEHREQHLETSSEKSDDKSSQSALSTKDIIHECSLCYMVFPNEHSLNKHTIICQRKKRQSASKLRQIAEVVIEDSNDSALNSENNDLEEDIKPTNSDKIIGHIMQDEPKIIPKEVEIPKEIKVEEKVRKSISNEEPIEKKDKSITVTEKTVEPKSVTAEPSKPNHPAKSISTKVHNKQLTKTLEIKKKTPIKDRVPTTVTKRKRSLNMPPPADSTKPVESSDDDEVRYMLNPNFVEENVECRQFMKIRAHKRNSLQIERPNSKDLVKRRTSLQHPPKIPRVKTKSVEHKTPPVPPNVQKRTKEESVASVDSDDSDVKYSFPEKTTPKATEKKTQRKSLAQKRKSLNGIAKRKSVGKVLPKLNETATKPFKRRTTMCEHRCDCGQLFSSAALLARHTTLAHTPPRVRRRRSPLPEPAIAKRSPPRHTQQKNPQEKNTKMTKDLHKSIKSETKRTPSHRCVPLPEKVKKVLEKCTKK